MEFIILVAMVFSIVQLRQRSIYDAVINVFLFTFLALPSIFALRITHLPPLGFGDAALIPIGFALVFGHLRQWKFQRSDVWLALFVGGLFYAELTHTGFANAGLLLFGALTGCVFPYMLGKVLLEDDGVRERFVRRFVLLLFIVSIISVWEFRMGMNLFTKICGIFFPGQEPWMMQIRGGFVRIAGPFSGSILGGMVLLVGLTFSMWLGFVDEQRGNEPKYLGLRRSTIFTLGIMAGLYMTQSRGPWIGAILAFAIARIGRAKNIPRAAILTLIFCIVGGVYGYMKVEQYTSGSVWEAKDLEQENAIYRRELLDNYKPIVAQAGAFGYGVVDWPKVPGQPSIDNEFLFLQITQGQVGFWSYVLLGVEALIAVFLAVRRMTDRIDICFALCLGGGIAGLLLSLTTVYMGAQSGPLFFLLIGWSQSLRQSQTARAIAPEAVPTRFSFRRVFA